MTRLLIGATLALVGGLLFVSLASAKAPAELKATESDFKIGLSTDSLPAGTPIKITITNNGPSVHEFIVERAGDVDKALEVNGEAYEAQDIAPGETRTVEWTVSQAGKYQFACHVPGHFEKGMKAEFTALAAPGTLPKTGEAENRAPMILGLLALLALGGGLALRYRKA